MRIPRVGFQEPFKPISARQVAKLGVPMSVVIKVVRLTKESQPWKA